MTDAVDARGSQLRTQLREGRVTLGAWCMLPDALATEAVAGLGFDWVCIDMQHGGMDLETAVHMIRAVDLAGVTPVVRVPWNEPGIIGRVLDAGALGLIIPMIEDAADARGAVDAARYPPAGRRSFGPTRVGLRDGPGYFADADQRVAVIPMIETRGALDQVDAILAVEGVDAVFIGPYDLSVALGLPPGENDGEPAFDRALATVVDACRRAGRGAAILSGGAKGIRRVEQGFTMISVAGDVPALVSGCRRELGTVRKGLPTD